MKRLIRVAGSRGRLVLGVVALAGVCAAVPSVAGASAARAPGPQVRWTWPGAEELMVSTSTPGSGYVQSVPYRIDCPGACNRYYSVGDIAVVTATPSAGYAFAGWVGGACAGGNNPCVITITRDTYLMARFEPTGDS